MKWDVGQVAIRNAHVHDNDCRGLWADINARNALIEHNLIEDNVTEGIALRDQPGRGHPLQPGLRQRAPRRRLVLGRRHHGDVQLQRRGLRQPPVRQLTESPGPSRTGPTRPRRPTCWPPCEGLSDGVCNRA
jgi:hypothetical protein